MPLRPVSGKASEVGVHLKEGPNPPARRPTAIHSPPRSRTGLPGSEMANCGSTHSGSGRAGKFRAAPGSPAARPVTRVGRWSGMCPLVMPGAAFLPRSADLTALTH